MTQNQPISLQQTAMYFGTLMGLFWIIKFTFLPLGFTIPLLQLLFVLLTFFVPILGYLYARKFRNRYCGGSITFSRAFAFTVLMYLFAALLAAVAHYIYFRYIDNGFLIDSYIGQLEAMKPTAISHPADFPADFAELPVRDTAGTAYRPAGDAEKAPMILTLIFLLALWIYLL